jgi:UV DNA damage endonuclease
MNNNNIRLGYACINMELQESKDKVQCSRGMIRRTFDKQGLSGASKLALQNVTDLARVIKWNNNMGIKAFRITSCLFPWGSEYALEQLPDFERISKALAHAGKLARDGGQRLSFHPGPFNILTSPKEDVVKNSYTDLEMHGKIFDLMGMPRDHWSKINIHIGASYGSPEASMERWCRNFEGLSESVRTRLTVENDDKRSLYSSKMLYEGVFKRVGVPIVWDSHHDELGPQDSTPQEAFEMAKASWPKGIRPVCHHSNSKKLFEDSTVAENAHSDYYFKPFPEFASGVDVMLEAKAKEKALFKYIKDFGAKELLAA